MVNRSRPTLLKREREKARQQRQKDKTARRLEAKSRKSAGPRREGDEDPDIAGIVPGPQPMPWLDDMDETGESGENGNEDDSQ
jgi:hypothetical protein